MSMVQSVLGVLGLHELRVVDVDDLAPRLRRLRLSTATLRGVSSTPGDKVQLMSGFALPRTYTPFDVDVDGGAFSIVGFVHGDGPGSLLIRDAKVGDAVRCLGPRGSLDVDVDGDVVLVGDATSIGVAAALARAPRPSSKRVFLIGDAAVGAACAAVGVDAVVKGAVDVEVEAAVASAGAVFLTGGAPLIQRLKTKTTKKPKAKAYWAPGKRGLD